MLLLREAYGNRAASHGYVRYCDRTFAVELDAGLEARVREAVAAIRSGSELRSSIAAIG
jgi:hypothetical protein